MIKYIFKRIGLMWLSFFIIFVICFIAIRMLESPTPIYGRDAIWEASIREALGYNKPILIQLAVYLKNVFLEFNWGYSFKIEYYAKVTSVIGSRLLPTLLINLYSLLFSIPLGIVLGVYAALKKNKISDHVISTNVMVFVSVPSYVYAFLIQYFICFKAGLFPLKIYSLNEASSWMSIKMFYSMIPPILALSFSTIAGLARFTRAELTEVLTSDFMLLARTKGLTKTQAVKKHALNNAMVPILPSIISMFVGVLSGSLIIEKIFQVPGIGSLYLDSINQLDLDLFVAVSMFYTFVGLLSAILIDISYGFLDPRIRMGAKK